MRLYAFEARFHANVQASHESTLEVTCEDRLTPRGDCIVLTSSTHDPRALAEACPEGWEGFLIVVTRFGSFWVKGTCAPKGVGCSFVLRKSSEVKERTLMIGVDKAAKDLPRATVKLGRLWGARALVILASRPTCRGRAAAPAPSRAL